MIMNKELFLRKEVKQEMNFYEIIEARSEKEKEVYLVNKLIRNRIDNLDLLQSSFLFEDILTLVTYCIICYAIYVSSNETGWLAIICTVIVYLGYHFIVQFNRKRLVSLGQLYTDLAEKKCFEYIECWNEKEVKGNYKRSRN